MSNFQTLSPVTGGVPGTAPSMFVAVTTDALATITAAGYVADLVTQGVLKTRDILFITYSDGTGDVATEVFNVTATSGGSIITGLSMLGVKAAVAEAHGGADGVITDPDVTADSIVIVTAKSMSDDKILYTAAAADGQINIGFSADPGANLIYYLVIN